MGACVCTVSMLLPVVLGTAGAATAVMGSMAGMSGMTTSAQQTGLLWGIVNAVNAVGQPLLIASIALTSYGMRDFGRLPLVLAAIGGFLLYVSMYVLGMSIAMIAISGAVIATSYGIAYGPYLTKSH